MEYDEMTIRTFLEGQDRLFDEPVAETEEEAAAFLEDCLAQVFDSFAAMRRYFVENMDASGMSDEEILEQAEIFPLPDGSFLIVEG